MKPLNGWEPVEDRNPNLRVRGSGARVSEMFPERFPAKSGEISRNLPSPRPKQTPPCALEPAG